MSPLSTDFQIAETALQKVLATLPCDREVLEQLSHTGLPFICEAGNIYGPALDNAAVVVLYPSNWEGLAVSTKDGNPSFWFFYQCEVFRERAMACLGSQPSVCAAIEAAVHHVKADLKHWNGHCKAA